MLARFTLSLSAILVLMCQLPNVTPSAPGALQAETAAIETVTSETALFLSTGNFNINTLVHTKVLRNTVFVDDTGQFDNEIDFAGSEGLDSMRQHISEIDLAGSEGLEVMKVDRPQRLSRLSRWSQCRFLMSCYFTKQVLAQLALFEVLEGKNTAFDLAGSEGLDGKIVANIKPSGSLRLSRRSVYLSPPQLDEQRAKLHLGSFLNPSLLRNKHYAGVKLEGPFKGGDYRY